MDSGQYQRATGRLPDWYLQQPPFVRGDEVYMHAWSVLDTERQTLVIPRSNEQGQVFWNVERSRIPWGSAMRYAEASGWSRRFQLWFANLILTLDVRVKERRREEADKQRRKAKREARREAARQERLKSKR